MGENKTLFVTGFPNDTDKEYVQELFSPYGKLTRVDYFVNKNIAFIEYDTPDAANFALYTLNGTTQKYGNKLKVNWARKKEDETKKKDQEEQQTKETTTVTPPAEQKVTEIERPDTPVGFELATKPTQNTGGGKRNKKNKKIAREIQHPTVQTTKPQQPQETTGGQKQQDQNTNQSPANKQPGGQKKQQARNNQQQEEQQPTGQKQPTGKKGNQNVKNNQQEEQTTTPTQTTKKNQPKKQTKKNVTNYEVVIRNANDGTEIVVATYNDNGSEIVDNGKLEEMLAKFNK